jgi:hypothetical protein
MNETTETGLGLSISGGVMTALSSISGAGIGGLATLGTVLIPVGIVFVAMGLYQTARKVFTPNEAAVTAK